MKANKMTAIEKGGGIVAGACRAVKERGGGAAAKSGNGRGYANTGYRNAVVLVNGCGRLHTGRILRQAYTDMWVWLRGLVSWSCTIREIIDIISKGAWLLAFPRAHLSMKEACLCGMLLRGAGRLESCSSAEICESCRRGYADHWAGESQ
ncbi:hypothetical protein NDU88_001120 [Pleurodeles waltl]|uniref:Uncharacterized protein n=1 Tax=Pleurodeles waltl TaxID=8319 RepID=A0AAV7LWQ6_PLEWA|nr:hypothetical protein NDU88_001120 [Pleurodeles waltl]